MTIGLPERTVADRRSHPRYPVKLALRFLIRTGKFASVSGGGSSLNVSSTGMLFRSAKRISDADTITVAVEWPAAPDGKPMILLVHGHVVWIKGVQVGMSVSHYGFLPQDASLVSEDLDRLALRRHLTPTRASAFVFSGVRQWRKSAVHWR
jgi:PilZ domain